MILRTSCDVQCVLVALPPPSRPITGAVGAYDYFPPTQVLSSESSPPRRTFICNLDLPRKITKAVLGDTRMAAQPHG